MGRKLSDTARPLTRLATLDSEPDRLLKLWQEAGRIPTHYIDKYGSKIPYTSWDQIDKEYLTRIEAAERFFSPTELKKSSVKAKIAKKVREEMGITYKNVIGNHTLSVNKNGERGLNKRAIREDINIEAENWIRKKKGDGVFESYKKRLLKEWNTVNKRDMANVRKWFHSAAGKAKLHRGHGFAALVGGGLLADNVAAEIGWRNVGHGPAPRFSVEIMEALNMPKNDLEGFYFYDLKKKGLTISNKPNTPLMLAADTGAISPNQLELIQLKLDDLRTQGVSSQTIDRFSQDVSELGRETTGGNVGKGQIKPETRKNRPTIRREHRPKQYTAATAFGNVQEAAAKRSAIATGLTLNDLGISKRTLFRLGIPAIGGLAAVLSIDDARARGEQAEETGYWLDHVQANIAKIEAAADTAGAVPNPASVYAEPAGLVSGLANLTIDLTRTKPTQEIPESYGRTRVEMSNNAKPDNSYINWVTGKQTETDRLIQGYEPGEEVSPKDSQKLQQYREYRAGGGDAAVSGGMTRKQVIELGQGNLRVKDRGIQQRADKSGLSFLEQELYEAGGGNAAMTKYGWTIEQTMLQGRKNLNVQDEQLRLRYAF